MIIFNKDNFITCLNHLRYNLKAFSWNLYGYLEYKIIVQINEFQWYNLVSDIVFLVRLILNAFTDY